MISIYLIRNKTKIKVNNNKCYLKRFTWNCVAIPTHVIMKVTRNGCFGFSGTTIFPNKYTYYLFEMDRKCNYYYFRIKDATTAAIFVIVLHTMPKSYGFLKYLDAESKCALYILSFNRFNTLVENFFKLKLNNYKCRNFFVSIIIFVILADISVFSRFK